MTDENNQTEAASDGQENADAPELSPEEQLARRVAELEQEMAAQKDKTLRALAEAENTRRRAIRDREEAEKYGGTRLARDLLSVYDNLERALEQADDSLREQAAPFIEGVELTRKELVAAFAKHQIEAVRPELGDRFDPNLHQAMFEAPVPHAEPGTVIQVMQDGFSIAGRLLRPAMVGVARAAPDAPKPAPEAAPEDDDPMDYHGATGGGGDHRPPPPRPNAASKPRRASTP